jgi:UDP:flavonoid glycosyltransferase YjiC (YdhE family)
MRIAIIATGSRGDVQPYLALAKGFTESGHSVRFVTHQNYEELVHSVSLDYWPIPGDVQNIVQSADMRERIEGGNFLLLMSQMAKEAQKGAVNLAQVCLEAAQGMDLLLAGMGGINIAVGVAEKLGLPVIQAYLLPFTPTRDFPSVLTSKLPFDTGGTFNRISHHITRQVMWQGFRSADTVARREVLDLPPAPFFGPYRRLQAQDLPVLYGFSPSVIPVPSDWRSGIHVTGYWFLESEKYWLPSPELIDFIEAGAPPVYIGFGSMSTRNPQKTARLVVEALKISNQRAIMLSGWSGLQAADLPDTIFMVDTVPHTWLFPQLSAVVHHGGVGTTAAGFRAGVPSVIIPFFGDQPFWGNRAVQLGVGPDPIPRKHLSADRLAAALQEATSSASYRKHATELGKRISDEDGVSNAVELIQHL